jgi:hypothetical protein
MPSGTGAEFGFALTTKSLIVSVRFTRTVQMAAPMRSRRLPRIEYAVEVKKATVCFITPLSEDKSREHKEK